jgi:hypothetical protein
LFCGTIDTRTPSRRPWLVESAVPKADVHACRVGAPSAAEGVYGPAGGGGGGAVVAVVVVVGTGSGAPVDVGPGAGVLVVEPEQASRHPRTSHEIRIDLENVTSAAI